MISIFGFLSNFTQEGQDPNLLEATRFKASHGWYEKFLKIYIFFLFEETNVCQLKTVSTIKSQKSKHFAKGLALKVV